MGGMGVGKELCLSHGAQCSKSSRSLSKRIEFLNKIY